MPLLSQEEIRQKKCLEVLGCVFADPTELFASAVPGSLLQGFLLPSLSSFPLTLGLLSQKALDLSPTVKLTDSTACSNLVNLRLSFLISETWD